MKKLLTIAASVLLMLGLAGCSDLNNRVDQLETDVKELQDAIKKLQAAVDAKVTVTGITTVENGSKVTFSDGSYFTITNGKDGKDGKDGENGKDGKDGKDGDTLIGSITVENGCAYITLSDGTSFTFPLYSPVGAVKALVFVPRYTDGKGTITKEGKADLDFHVYPASATAGLKAAYDKQELTVDISTVDIKTREDEGEEVPPCRIEFNVEDGFVYFRDVILKDEGENIAVSIGFEDNFSAVYSDFILMERESTIKHGGVEYTIRKMKDGKVWMTENLCYLPEGYTPCNDLNNVTAGVYYPLTLNLAEDGLEFCENPYIIKTNGYLYQSEVALGLKVGDIKDEETAAALEGVQGICPSGWHIPTADDILGLVGKAVSPYETNVDAPYYDSTLGGASLALLNADDFNFAPVGAISIANTNSTKGTMMGYLKSNPGAVSSGFYCGSTYTGSTKDKEGNITNYQFLGIMPMANQGTSNGSKLSFRIAAAVRCVKNN